MEVLHVGDTHKENILLFSTKDLNFKLFSTNFWSPKKLGMAPDPKKFTDSGSAHGENIKLVPEFVILWRPRISPLERKGQ